MTPRSARKTHRICCGFCVGFNVLKALCSSTGACATAPAAAARGSFGSLYRICAQNANRKGLCTVPFHAAQAFSLLILPEPLSADNPAPGKAAARAPRGIPPNSAKPSAAAQNRHNSSRWARRSASCFPAGSKFCSRRARRLTRRTASGCKRPYTNRRRRENTVRSSPAGEAAKKSSAAMIKFASGPAASTHSSCVGQLLAPSKARCLPR